LKVNERIKLELLTLDHADDLFQLVDTNRVYLKEWLPWLDFNRSVQDTIAFIKSVIEQYESGSGPQYAIFYDRVMCGVCGYHPIDRASNIGSIGYWLDEACCGKGIATNAVRALIEVGFREYQLNRIEIACANKNYRSRGIPERLEFKLEGVLREYECLYGSYVDCAIYSKIASEYALDQRLQGGAAVLRT
jgi:ribosomal-protein-serine acetyltransferase